MSYSLPMPFLRTLPFVWALFSSLAVAQNIRVSSEVSIEGFKPVFEKLLRSAGFVPQISYVPGERSFQMLRNGEVDMEYTRTKVAVASIKDFVTLVGPVGCIEGVAFTRSDAPIAVSTPSDLQNYKVAVPFVHKTAVDYATKNKLKVEVVNKRDSLFKMLEAGRFDLAVDGSLAGLIATKELGLTGKIARTGPVLFSEPIYIVVTNQHTDWASRLQKAFDAEVHNGSWQSDVGEINVAYGLPKEMGLSCLKSSGAPGQ